MEFLRFGSSIPGSYWGCCDCCIIQNFKTDPSSKASIQLVDGDGGYPITNSGGFMFAGPTEADIFRQRLRYGTFSNRDMPNHVFFAVLTKSQIEGAIGKKWLEILKSEGFEFLFASDNSVYSGEETVKKPGTGTSGHGSHPNYYFALIRNIGTGAAKKQFEAPKSWTDLPDPYSGDMSFENRQAVQLSLYNALPKGVFYSETQLTEMGVPITYAGQRSEFPQEPKAERDRKTKAKEMSKAKPSASKAVPWAAALG